MFFRGFAAQFSTAVRHSSGEVTMFDGRGLRLGVGVRADLIGSGKYGQICSHSLGSPFRNTGVTVLQQLTENHVD